MVSKAKREGSSVHLRSDEPQMYAVPFQFSVELWTLPAEQFLAQADVGVTPWVPLMHFDGPPEALLERCAEKIEREAHPKD